MRSANSQSGVVGSRNVKWLQRVVLRNDEGLGPWNNHYYNSKERATPRTRSAPFLAA